MTEDEPPPEGLDRLMDVLSCFGAPVEWAYEEPEMISSLLMNFILDQKDNDRDDTAPD